MGKEIEKVDSKIIFVSVDVEGSIVFDVVVKQVENVRKIVFLQYCDFVLKVFIEVDIEKFLEEEVEVIIERMKVVLEKIIEGRLSVVQLKSVLFQFLVFLFIKYIFFQ